MSQVAQLPEEFRSWWTSGGLSSTLHSALQRLTAAQQLNSTAALPGQQHALLSVQPHTGVDFGTNQVVVIEEDAKQGQPTQQQKQQQQQKTSRQQEAGGGLCVERELVIRNVHTSRTVLLLNICLVSDQVSGMLTWHPIVTSLYAFKLTVYIYTNYPSAITIRRLHAFKLTV